MSTIDINSFWNQVLNDTKKVLADVVWEQMIQQALFPTGFDPTKAVLQLAAMQKYKMDFILGNAQLSTTLQQIITKLALKNGFIGEDESIHVIITAIDTNQSAELIAAYPLTATPTAPAAGEDAPKPASDDVPYGEDYTETYADNLYGRTGEPLPGEVIPPAAPEPKRPAPANLNLNRPVYTDPILIDRPTAPTDDYGTLDEGLFAPTYAQQGKKPNQDSLITLPEDTLKPDIDLSDSTLNPSFTFESFVQGGSNQLAYAAALAVAERPAERYNPLFIYGQSGLGKTHLMHAIGNRLLETHPSLKVMCITSENFLNLFVESIRSKQNTAFRNKFRRVDILLVDDIQFIQDKRYTGTQMEFFHTFNDLMTGAKQIILTSDTLPKDMDQMEDRLKTRFASGMVVTIDPPNPEMLEAILKSTIDRERVKYPSLQVPNEVIRYLGKQFNKRSIRDLQGALNSLIMSADVDHRLDAIDVEYTRQALRDLIPDDEEPALSIHYIQTFIANFFQIKRDALLSQKRNKQYAYPRQIAMYLCRELLNESYPGISNAFGKKDHTTALHAYEKISKEIEENKDSRRLIDEITGKLKGQS